MRLRTAFISEAGPRLVNEDAVDIWTTADGSLIATVADGLGGMGSGGTASKIAISSIKDFLSVVNVTQEALNGAARFAHDKIRAAQKDGTHQMKMATTLTLVAFLGHRLIGVHSGDTRVSIARGQGIRRLTTDHSEAQRLFEAGKLTREEMLTYPRQHILESALGIQDEPRIDPISFDVLPGDKFAITSDGVHGIILLKELKDLFSGSKTPDEFVERVKFQIERKKPNDNYSIAAIFAD